MKVTTNKIIRIPINEILEKFGYTIRDPTTTIDWQRQELIVSWTEKVESK